MSIEGKIALVTGATRGIGKAIAAELSAQGAIVVGTATSESGAASIKNALVAAGNTGTGIVLNVSDSESIKKAYDFITENYEAPSIVVNNAGITKDNIMLRMKDEEWDDVINTNLTSIYRVTKAALRAMTKARWGRIINISSVVGAMGNAGQANYAAAKAGLHGASKSLALELASRRITVNVIAPGIIESPMSEQSFPPDLVKKLVPMQRTGTPEEVADLVSFLASDKAGYISGQVISIDGAMT